MDGKITLARAMIESARDYIPLAVKEAWVAENAPKCFDKLAITADSEPMPPMYMCNTGRKSRYLMAALVGLYFGQDYNAESEENPALMTVEDYDRWAGSHVLNQVERWKREPDLRDKCFDILSDYKNLEKRFSAQITALLTVQNDPVIRQNEMTSDMVKELPMLLEQLKGLQAEKGEIDGESA